MKAPLSSSQRIAPIRATPELGQLLDRVVRAAPGWAIHTVNVGAADTCVTSSPELQPPAVTRASQTRPPAATSQVSPTRMRSTFCR